MAKLIAGKLEVIEEIDRGDGTPIFKVRHPLMDALLTVSTLPPELTAEPAQRAHLQEAVRAAFELRHGHIVQVVDLVEDAGNFLLVEAFVAGEPLDRLLRASGPLPPADALLIARQLAEALAHAHDRGVIHGGLTPSRILVEQGVTPRAMLTGFATAGLAPAPIAYRAPERLAGEGMRATPRVDIFALGLVLFEMLEGRAFFAGVSEDAIIQRLRDSAAPLLPQFTRIPLTGVAALVSRAIRRNPPERTHSMEQLGREIDAFLRRLMHRKYANAKYPVMEPITVVAKPATPRPAAGSRPIRKIVLEELEAEGWDIPATPVPLSRAKPQAVAKAPDRWRTLELIAGAIAACVLVAGFLLRPPRLTLERAPSTPRPAEKATIASEPPPTLAEAPAPVAPTPPPQEDLPRPAAATVEPVAGPPVASAEDVPSSPTATNPVLQPEEAAPVPPPTTPPIPNRAPRIVNTQPRQGETLTASEGTDIDFSARAIDDDPNDRVSYAWFLGGREVGRRERWRFAVPPAATAATHTVELRVADSAGVEAPRLAWSIQVSPRISEDDVHAWLRRYEAAWEQKDLAALRRFGAVDGDADAAELEEWLGRQKGYRVAIDNTAIRTDGSHARVVFDRADFDEDGRLLVTKRESFALEKQADGSVIVRTP